MDSRSFLRSGVIDAIKKNLRKQLQSAIFDTYIGILRYLGKESPNYFVMCGKSSVYIFIRGFLWRRPISCSGLTEAPNGEKCDEVVII